MLRADLKNKNCKFKNWIVSNGSEIRTFTARDGQNKRMVEEKMELQGLKVM